jgi:hypothetical protein
VYNQRREFKSGQTDPAFRQRLLLKGLLQFSSRLNQRIYQRVVQQWKNGNLNKPDTFSLIIFTQGVLFIDPMTAYLKHPCVRFRLTLKRLAKLSQHQVRESQPRRTQQINYLPTDDHHFCPLPGNSKPLVR